MPNQEALWVVVEYEVEMFIGTTRLLRSEKPKFKDFSMARNAILESRLLHTRILIDILLDRTKSSDDITLSELIESLEPTDELYTSIRKLKSAYGTNQENTPCWTLNKKPAHPTKLRSNSYDWGSTLNKIDGHIYHILRLLAELSGRQTLRLLLSD